MSNSMMKYNVDADPNDSSILYDKCPNPDDLTGSL